MNVKVLLKPQPFAATEEVLRSLKNHGARHFILTHRLTESTWELLGKYGLTDLIEEVVGIDQNFPRKPSPASLELSDRTFRDEKIRNDDDR